MFLIGELRSIVTDEDPWNGSSREDIVGEDPSNAVNYVGVFTPFFREIPACLAFLYLLCPRYSTIQ